MKPKSIHKKKLLGKLEPEWPLDVLPEIRKCLRADNRKVVVLDDDPTGTQTVHNLPVLTEWTIPSLVHEFHQPETVFYILTNSRSLPTEEAVTLNREIGDNLLEASGKASCDFVVVSRSDSTLRGHYPAETDALALAVGGHFDGSILIPFFFEGGRFTVDDVHYVLHGDTFVPAAQTPFAKDKAFGFTNSNLRAWVTEKTGNRISPEDVISISIGDLRSGGPETVVDKLLEVENSAVCIVNAASMRDIEVFTLGALLAEKQGKRFLYRTAASFVRAMAGLAEHPLIREVSSVKNSGGVLMMVGSYVPKTTRQIKALQQYSNIVSIEVQVEALLNDDLAAKEVGRVAILAGENLEKGCNVLIYTSRRLFATEGARANLNIGQTVSKGLVDIVRMLKHQPSCLVAKGGITSSDIATEGLGIKRGWVKGQILPGVPVWECGPETRWPGMTYVVFPGNVGEDDALIQILNILQKPARQERE